MAKHNSGYIRSMDTSLHVQFSIAVIVFYAVLAIISLLPDAALAGYAGYINPSNTPDPASSVPTVSGDEDRIDPVTHVFYVVVHHATGFTGKAICTIAIIVAGIAALFGKISWGQGLIISAGVALVFGCVAIMNMIVIGNQGQIVTPDAITCSMPFGGGLAATITSIVPANVSFLVTPLNPACGLMVKLVNTIQGELAAGIGSLFVLFLGLAALFGRVSWPQAVVLATGIGLIFGAASIVHAVWIDPRDCNLQVSGILGSVSNLLSGGGTPTASQLMAAVLSGVTPEFVVCQYLMILQGTAGKMMATLAVIIMGFLAMLGRISWQYAVVVMVGIACVFGSHQILTILLPGSTSSSCSNALLQWSIPGTLGPIERVLCDIHSIITGPVGKALASCSIIMLGFGAMIGKVSYHAALVTAIGIAITFGAPQIVFYLTLAVDVCVLPNKLQLPPIAADPACSALNTIFAATNFR